MHAPDVAEAARGVAPQNIHHVLAGFAVETTEILLRRGGQAQGFRRFQNLVRLNHLEFAFLPLDKNMSNAKEV